MNAATRAGATSLFVVNGILKYRVHQLVEAIPALVQLSMFLFIAGLIVYLSDINHTVLERVNLQVQRTHLGIWGREPEKRFRNYQRMSITPSWPTHFSAWTMWRARKVLESIPGFFQPDEVKLDRHRGLA